MYSKSSRFIIPFSFLIIVLTLMLLLFLLLNDLGTKNTNSEESDALGKAIGSILESDDEFEIIEVIRHNTKEDCYVIIEEEVYDFTKSFEKEPNLIKSSECGTDITAFARNFNKSDLKQYYLGRLKSNNTNEN